MEVESRAAEYLNNYSYITFLTNDEYFAGVQVLIKVVVLHCYSLLRCK